MQRASQQWPLRPPALKDFFESNLNFKCFHKISRITALAVTVLGRSGIITFGEKDSEATILYNLQFYEEMNKRPSRMGAQVNN